MTDHGGWKHTLGRLDVMSAAGRVNMMVAGPPTELGWINPSFHLERSVLGICRYIQGAAHGHRFRTAAHDYVVLPRRQAHIFTVATIDLRMEEKVRLDTLRLERVYAVERVANLESRHGGLAVLILHLEGDK